LDPLLSSFSLLPKYSICVIYRREKINKKIIKGRRVRKCKREIKTNE
jgi:hypothetical protein